MRMKGKGLISLFLIVEVDDQHAQRAIISKKILISINIYTASKDV